MSSHSSIVCDKNILKIKKPMKKRSKENLILSLVNHTIVYINLRIGSQVIRPNKPMERGRMLNNPAPPPNELCPTPCSIKCFGHNSGFELGTKQIDNTFGLSYIFRPTLHQKSGPKNLGANFEHFWVTDWPQVINKCQNIDTIIVLNAETLAPRVANCKMPNPPRSPHRALSGTLRVQPGGEPSRAK